MITMKRLLACGFTCAAALALLTPRANAVVVSTEIVLLADVSGSVDATDFALQRDGYVAAFQSASVKQAIAQSGPIAATFVYWSDSQSIAVPWTLISDAASADAFAASILAAARPFSGGTSMAAAMNFGSNLFANNGFEGTRLVMDVSGDGADSDNGSFVLNAPNVQAARDNALNNLGVTTINALWINDRDFFGIDPADSINALDYGNLNVIGGASSFQSVVSGFPEFASAIEAKIGREIAPPPPGVPDSGATIVMLGLVFVGLMGLRRKIGL